MADTGIWLQLAFFVSVLALAVVVLVGRPGCGRATWVLCGVMILAATAACFAWWTRHERRVASHTSLVNEVPVLGLPEAEFVSSDKCRACHPGKYASWHDSYHRTMTQLASPEAVVGDFDDQTLAAKGRTYRLERDGDEYWVEMVDPDWERDLVEQGIYPNLEPNPPRVWKRIVMTTGSHHMQTYWVASERDGRLFNFPWLWLNEDQRWIPREDGFIRPPDAARSFSVWHGNCIECHATAGEKNEHPEQWNPSVAELGIACEACHGPAEAHIRANQNPERRYRLRMSGDPDPTIVNPARLGARASAQVCGQCHGMNVWKTAEHKQGLRYRAGDDLLDTRMILRMRKDAMWPDELEDYDRLQRHITRELEKDESFLADRFWPDGMVRVSGRDHNGLIESACFMGGELSCISCHSMHDSDPNDQLASGMDGDEACFQCHESFRDDIEAHTFHSPGSSGSRCYDCHMPRTVYGLMTAIRSHWIDSPTAAKTVETGRPNACNLCHLDRTLEWTANHLAEWFDQPKPAMSADARSVASGVRWALSGNANQRALAAWHMALPEAIEASGTDWMGLPLGHLLDDPYPAVRHIAYRSLRRLPGYETLLYEFTGPADHRAAARENAIERWTRAPRPRLDRPALLMTRGGTLDRDAFERLASQRDDRPMDLRE